MSTQNNIKSTIFRKITWNTTLTYDADQRWYQNKNSKGSCKNVLSFGRTMYFLTGSGKITEILKNLSLKCTANSPDVSQSISAVQNVQGV